MKLFDHLVIVRGVFFVKRVICERNYFRLSSSNVGVRKAKDIRGLDYGEYRGLVKFAISVRNLRGNLCSDLRRSQIASQAAVFFWHTRRKHCPTSRTGTIGRPRLSFLLTDPSVSADPRAVRSSGRIGSGSFDLSRRSGEDRSTVSTHQIGHSDACNQESSAWRVYSTFFPARRNGGP